MISGCAFLRCGVICQWQIKAKGKDCVRRGVIFVIIRQKTTGFGVIIIFDQNIVDVVGFFGVSCCGAGGKRKRRGISVGAVV